MAGIGVFGYDMQQSDLIAQAQKASSAKEVETQESFGCALNRVGKNCPYSALAKDGVINYKGVTFVCDYEHNAITLGDVTSNPKKVLNIALSGGGCLKVNVDNIGDLANAAGMFSPEDLNAILRAIHEYNHFTSKLEEAEEEEIEEIEEVAESSAKELSLMESISAYRSEIYRKLMNNETEQKFAIGNKEYSVSEWNKLLESFDKAEEKIQEEIEEELEEQEEKEKKQEYLETENEQSK